MGKGRRITTMADGWIKIIQNQPRPEPIQPRDHLSATWCAHGWACRACPQPSDVQPKEKPPDVA